MDDPQQMESIFKAVWPEIMVKQDNFHLIQRVATVIPDRHAKKWPTVHRVRACLVQPYAGDQALVIKAAAELGLPVENLTFANNTFFKLFKKLKGRV